jgi:hypothetical protein
MAEQPGKKLPVAARPTMLTFGHNVIAGGKFLDNLDIGRETGAGENAFE